MTAESPGNPLHERYASREMAAIFSTRNRYATWRRLWIVLAECQRELGLPIRAEQIAALRAAAPRLDLARVAELEAQTRHDVVAHLRHFAEQAGATPAASSTSAPPRPSSPTTPTSCSPARRSTCSSAAWPRRSARSPSFARRYRALPCLAYTHFQPAQLTTVGKRACLWAQDLVLDLAELRHRRAGLLCRGVKGTTGTQASFLTLFDGDHDKVRELDRRVAERLGFAGSIPVSGQTYTRKHRLPAARRPSSGIAESCHKMGTDLRLLQGVGELAEPFDEQPGRLLGDGLQAQPGARRADVRPGAPADDRRAQRPAQHRDAVARAQPRRLRQPAPGAARRLPRRRRRALARRARRRRAAGERAGGRRAGPARAAVHGDRDAADAGRRCAAATARSCTSGSAVTPSRRRTRSRAARRIRFLLQSPATPPSG